MSEAIITPPVIDFLSPAALQRVQSGIKNNLLARAVGLKKGYRPFVVDATAGLGRDAYLLSRLGCRVQMIERNPVIAAALRDAIKRAQTDPTFAALDFTLIEASAITYLSSYLPDNRPDVIYLDPMHPVRTKSALVKQPMRQLRQIVGSDNDAPTLLAQALTVAKERVVVKRPRLSGCLTERMPNHRLLAKNVRFDIYGC